MKRFTDKDAIILRTLIVRYGVVEFMFELHRIITPLNQTKALWPIAEAMRTLAFTTSRLMRPTKGGD